MNGPPEREVDVLVVGAGPAGSSAALAAAVRGATVLLVERRPVVGSPMRCGEYVPDGLARELPESAGPLPAAQRVPALVLHLPSGRDRAILSPGAVLDRARLDRSLAGAAVAAGAELWLESPLLALDRRGLATIGRGAARAPARVRARLIVGADGPRSRVAAAGGLGRPRVMLGLQREARLARPVHRAHLYFWKTCRHGYGWLFPKGAVANLGVAVPRGAAGEGRAALRELDRRLAEAGVIEPPTIEGAGAPGRGGLVPCGGPLPRLAAGRVLLAGDAAGQTDALTGAGIVAAVRAGAMAGEAAADALRRGAWREAGPCYDARWRRVYGRTAARALERRAELEARWDRDVERAVAAAWLHEREVRDGRDDD